MKRTVVFSLFFLLLVVSVSGTAFAGRDWAPPTPEVIILVCQGPQTAAPFFYVSAIDNASTVTLPAPGPTVDCAATIVTLKEDKFVIRSVEALAFGSPSALNIIYTLVSREK